MTQSSGAYDRSYATLAGLALGDALGMPAQTLPRAEIRRHYGHIDEFLAPFDGHPVSHGLQAGQITDDTEQTLLLAHRLIAEPDGFDDLGWAHDLLEWEAGIRVKGLSDLLGPSSRAAIDALLQGASPAETGKRGTTNGAAMRIAPVGIMIPPNARRIVETTARTCRVTHNTGEAIAAAAAVAMVVSCGVEGRDFDASLDPALETARLAQRQGNAVGEQDMAGRIQLALDLADQGDQEVLIDRIGSSVASRESIPMAFGLLKLAKGDLWQAITLAANIGDDTDTIGAIAGAMAGATAGIVPDAALQTLLEINAIDLATPARALCDLREQALKERA